MPLFPVFGRPSFRCIATIRVYNENKTLLQMAHVNIELSTSESESELENLRKSSSDQSRFVYDDEDDEEAKSNRKSPTMSAISRRPHEARSRMSAMAFQPQKSSSESSDSGTDNTNGSKSQPKTSQIDGTYNPANFNDLKVSTETKDLFQHIMRYIPQRIDLEYKLKPFIPEFIPAVGDTDAFLKVVTPPKSWNSEPFDGSQLMQLGLEVLDEPSAAQSDSALLFLQLRATEKTSKKSSSHLTIKKVFDVEKNTKAIDQWINDISDLHGSHPPPTVIYKNTMPDVDSLLQDWPQEEANALKDGFPNYQLNCSLEQYVELVCSIFDIPVFESRIESLHMLFSMCLAIKNYYTYITTAEALEVEAKKLNAPDVDSDNEQVIMK